MADHVDTFLEDVENFSGKKLQHKSELAQLCAASGFPAVSDSFSSILFTAKYIQGLMRVIEQAAKNPEIHNLQQIKQDLTVNLEKFTGDLKSFLQNESEQIQGEFENKFLSLTGESFLQLRNLLSDLEWVKMYLNHLNRTK